MANFPWEEHAAGNRPQHAGRLLSRRGLDRGGQTDWPVAFAIKARTTLLRDLGAALSPFNAFQIIQGLETLALRIRAHSENAARVADFLADHPAVTRVIYPGRQEGVAKTRADTYLTGGYGGLVGFELADGADAGRRLSTP